MEYNLTVGNAEEKEVDECFSNFLSGRDITSLASALMLVIKTYQCWVPQSIHLYFIIGIFILLSRESD